MGTIKRVPRPEPVDVIAKAMARFRINHLEVTALPIVNEPLRPMLSIKPYVI